MIGQAVSEKKIFEYYCNIHVYCPGVGADQPLGSNSFQNHITSVHLPILTIFPIQMHGQPYADLAVK